MDDLFEHAKALQNQGRLNEAADSYRRVVAADPAEYRALNNLGVVLEALSELPEAVAAYRSALVIRSDVAGLHYNLGHALQAQNRLEEAVECYRRALELQPEHIAARCNLGNALWTLDRLPEAEAAVRQALALNPDSAPDHANLGRLLAAQQQFDAAKAAYRRALELQPTLPVARERLAELYYCLQEPEQALAVYAEVLKLFPDDPIARHIIAAYGEAETPARASDAYVEKLFDLFAESFDRNLKQLQYQAPELLAAAVSRVLPPLQERLDVLDAGCGTGLCQPYLRPYARRLIGVDLSEKMLERARHRGGYDELIKAELTAFLAGCSQAFDLIVSADTLVYFGDLAAVIDAAAGALRPGGWLAFTVEKDEEEMEDSAGFRLKPHGRYCHTRRYVWDTLEQAGFRHCSLTVDVLRLEQSRPVPGWVVLAEK